MRRALRRLGALALSLCLLAGTASAGITGLDETLSSYFDINDDVRMSVGFELKTLMPYGDDTIAMLNGVLKHLRMNASLSGTTALSLAADGERLLSLTEKEQEDGTTALTTSLLPNRTLTAQGSAMDKLFGAEAEQQPAFDLQTAISEAEDCYKALTDAIVPYATEKKANYKISGIGYAKWVRLAKLTAEQGDEILPPLIQLLGCGMDDEFKAEIASLACKNNFTVALYQTQENGDDLSVYVKGNVSLGEGDNRTLSYQWSFTRDEGKTKDAYKLELVKSKAPVKRRVIEASVTQSGERGKLDLAVASSVTLRTGADMQVITEKHSLKGQESGSKTTLTGKLVTITKTTADSKTQTVTEQLEPDLVLTSAEGSGVLSGSVKLTEKLGKNIQKEISVLLDDAVAKEMDSAIEDGSLYAVADSDEGVTITIDGSSLAQNMDVAQPADSSDYLVGKPPLGMTSHSAPRAMQTVDLDAATEDEIATLQDELTQNAAGVLLIALSKLPQEDRALLADNMTEDDFAALMQLVDGL